ncbi:MAG TPA: Spy/CpxP family protein refolding chaperone [Mariprofundaceae bacterium]|nr:Spy/CpxP family protein refolding chaperone [Mariprofundaceae bacterium]
MRKSFPIALALLFMLGGSLTAHADGMSMHNHHGMKGHHGKMECMKGSKGGHFAYMSKKLSLTEVQQEKAHAIFDRAHKKMVPLYKEKRELSNKLRALDPASRSYDREVKQIARKKGQLTERMVMARAETRKQFHMLLTPEQRAKAKEIMKKRKMMRDDRMKKRGERMERHDGMGPHRGMSM